MVMVYELKGSELPFWRIVNGSGARHEGAAPSESQNELDRGSGYCCGSMRVCRPSQKPEVSEMFPLLTKGGSGIGAGFRGQINGVCEDA